MAAYRTDAFGEQIVREWVSVESTPKPREYKPPQRQHPQAFIRWGRPSSFTVDDFRSQAEDPYGGFQIVQEPHPLLGTYVEEARTWQDLKIYNPENPEQCMIVPTIKDIAFKAPTRRQQDPRPHYEFSYVTMEDQITFSFKREYRREEPIPGYLRNEAGDEFEPYVVNPFQYVVDVGWPQQEFFIIQLLFESSVPKIMMELVNPPNANVNTEGGIGKDAQGRNVNIGDPVLDAAGNPIPDPNNPEEPLRHQGPSDPQTTMLATLGVGMEGEDPDTDNPTGAIEHFEGDPPFPGSIVADFGGYYNFNFDIDGATGGAIAITRNPDTGRAYPNGQKWMDQNFVEQLGADGKPFIFGENGREEWSGGLLTPKQGRPQQWKLARGIQIKFDNKTYTEGVIQEIIMETNPFTWFQWADLDVQPYCGTTDTDHYPFASNEIFPEDDARMDDPHNAGAVGCYDVHHQVFEHKYTQAFVYMMSNPAYSVQHPMFFTYYIGYINAYLLWKVFRDYYTGGAQLSNIPEPIEVAIKGFRTEPGEHDPPPGPTRARWSWHMGTPDAFAALTSVPWSNMNESEGGGGSGEGPS